MPVINRNKSKHRFVKKKKYLDDFIHFTDALHHVLKDLLSREDLISIVFIFLPTRTGPQDTYASFSTYAGSFRPTKSSFHQFYFSKLQLIIMLIRRTIFAALFIFVIFVVVPFV